MASGETIRVEVVYARPDVQRLIALDVVPGTTMAQAVEQSGVLTEFPEINLATAPMGIFSKIESTPAARVLQEGDRVELYRPLEMDPKEARKLRAERAKAKRRAAEG
jgi:putative ubiquitin-RnfH superfamily antitoxin RatB of RatAB toxin-antitoxin module